MTEPAEIIKERLNEENITKIKGDLLEKAEALFELIARQVWLNGVDQSLTLRFTLKVDKDGMITGETVGRAMIGTEKTIREAQMVNGQLKLL